VSDTGTPDDPKDKVAIHTGFVGRRRQRDYPPAAFPFVAERCVAPQRLRHIEECAIEVYARPRDRADLITKAASEIQYYPRKKSREHRSRNSRLDSG